jgi:hypothetical protein
MVAVVHHLGTKPLWLDEAFGLTTTGSFPGNDVTLYTRRG